MPNSGELLIEKTPPARQTLPFGSSTPQSDWAPTEASSCFLFRFVLARAASAKLMASGPRNEGASRFRAGARTAR